MRNTAFLAAGLLLLLVQANLHRLTAFVPLPWVAWLVPSLALPLVLFMGVHEYSMVRGAALAFLLGYVTDLFAGAPVGLFTFTSVAVFLLARAAGVRLAAQTPLTKIALAFVFAVVEGITVVVLLTIFREAAASYSVRALLPVIVPHAAATAAVSPLVFRLAERLHQATIGLARLEAGAR